MNKPISRFPQFFLHSKDGDYVVILAQGGFEDREFSLEQAYLLDGSLDMIMKELDKIKKSKNSKE